MPNIYQSKLNRYYKRKHIHPENFQCSQQDTCRRYAYQGNMTETKMSMVGSRYGAEYPKIVVVSLDPPSGKNRDNTNNRWEFIEPTQRTTVYISKTHEKDDYVTDHPNPHWAMTQIIVKDLLVLWGYPTKPNSATVPESYSGRSIENVSAYFAHVNVSKCFMNNEGQRQASTVVHQICSRAYLLEEMILLEPVILITQGATTNKILGEMLVGREILLEDLPRTETISLDESRTLWMPMHHPTQQLDKIRICWSKYLKAAKRLVKTERTH